MPSFNIHLAVAKRYLDKHNDVKDTKAFYKGSIAPDFVDDKSISHYTAKRRESINYSTFLLKKVILNDYLKDNDVTNDYEKGVFLHLVADKIFFSNFFDIDMLNNCITEDFLKNLYYSYDLLNDYLNDNYINIYDIFDAKKINNFFRKYKTDDGNRKSIIGLEKIKEFIEEISDISIDDYKRKVLEYNTHYMKLNSSAFERMKKGIKKREYRVNEEKRRKVKRGDIVIFKSLPNLDKELRMIVSKIEVFNNINDAVSLYYNEDFSNKYNSVKQATNSFYDRGFYTKEEVLKNGIVVFSLDRID